MASGVTNIAASGSAALAGWRQTLSGTTARAGSGAQKAAETGTGTQTSGAKRLSADEQKQVDQLAATDRKVKAHEMAHVSAGGGLVRSGASFTYQRGPDGQSYAVAGEVQIDTTKGKDASETLSKAARVRAAALAPADPSPQDRQVAAEAGQMEAEARSELRHAAMQSAQGSGQGSAQDAATAAPSGAGARMAAAYRGGAADSVATGVAQATRRVDLYA